MQVFQRRKIKVNTQQSSVEIHRIIEFIKIRFVGKLSQKRSISTILSIGKITTSLGWETHDLQFVENCRRIVLESTKR